MFSQKLKKGKEEKKEAVRVLEQGGGLEENKPDTCVWPVSSI